MPCGMEYFYPQEKNWSNGDEDAETYQKFALLAVRPAVVWFFYAQ